MAAGDLADPEKLKRLLKLTSAADDDVLAILITQASDYICSELSRSILRATYTERYDGRDNVSLFLRQFPIVSIASVLVDGVAVAASSGSAVSGWYQSGDREISLRGSVFSRGYGNVVVTYDAGFVTVPVRFETACLSTCRRWYHELGRVGQISKVVQGENVTFALGLPDDVKRLIAQERDVVPA